MKKIVIMLLAAMMLFAFTACDPNENSAKPNVIVELSDDMVSNFNEDTKIESLTEGALVVNGTTGGWQLDLNRNGKYVLTEGKTYEVSFDLETAEECKYTSNILIGRLSGDASVSHSAYAVQNLTTGSYTVTFKYVSEETGINVYYNGELVTRTENLSGYYDATSGDSTYIGVGGWVEGTGDAKITSFTVTEV